MASIIKGVYSLVKNLILNSVGVEREFIQLINDRDIGKVQSLMQNRDEIVNESICEYDPLKHKVTKRMDKDRLGDDPYFPRNYLVPGNDTLTKLSFSSCLGIL